MDVYVESSSCIYARNPQERERESKSLGLQQANNFERKTNPILCNVSLIFAFRRPNMTEVTVVDTVMIYTAALNANNLIIDSRPKPK